MSICSKYFDIWHSHLELVGALYAALGTTAIVVYLNNDLLPERRGQFP